MLGDSLSYLRNSSDWIPTTLIGGVLSVLSVLILPAFVLQGYFVRVMRGAATREDAAPSFTDWGGLFVDGLKLFAVNVAYGIPLMVVWFAVLFVTGAGSSTATPGAAPSNGMGVVAILGLLLVLAVFVAYFLPAAFANFAIEGTLGAAFDLSTVVSGATTGAYLKGWLLGLLVGVVGGLLSGFLFALVVGIFVLFYVQVATYYLFGRGFAEGLRSKRHGAVESNF